MRIILKDSVDLKNAQLLEQYFRQENLHYRYIEERKPLELIVNMTPEAIERIKDSTYANLIASVSPDKLGRYFTNRTYHPLKSILDIQGVQFGGQSVPIIAGPCAIESEEHIYQCADALSKLGVQILRGGAFKPRTSTYDFQGLGRHALVYISKASKQHGMLSISEIMDATQLDDFIEHIDIIQVGARNMQNFALLKVLGNQNKPILLKRGLSATYHEFLNAAEYIASRGNERIILCERGIRTYEQYTRNTLDISAIPVLNELSHLPIIIDPSHAIGRSEFVSSLSYAALAAGADGLMLEAHPMPACSVSDAAQTISFATLASIMDKGRQITKVFGKTLGSAQYAI